MLENLLSNVQANTASHVFRPAVMTPAVLPVATPGLGRDVFTGSSPATPPSPPLNRQQYGQLVDGFHDLVERLRTGKTVTKPAETEKPATPAPAKPTEQPKPTPPERPEAAKPAAPAPSAGPAHTVGGDETLWGIAQKRLGDGNRWREIYDLNKAVIGSNPNVIHAGQVLTLPGGAAAAPPAAKPPSEGTYTVGSGDTLSGIAQRTLGDGDRWGEIYDLNRDKISNPNVISAGMVLALPGGANSNPAPAARPAASGRNTNRSAIYIQQPNGWSCAPTSLTMAMAAFGVRPSNNATVNEAINLTGANAGVGLPGNASLVASAARKVGMQAQFVGDSSAGSVRAALNRGHGVVLNGSISGQGGHFVYVAGIQGDGRFIVCDPWRPNITSWSDAELNHFATGYAVNPRGFAEIWK